MAQADGLMDETTKEEIARLKADLLKKKAEIDDLRKLLNREIDRPFKPDPMEFTEREIEPFIEKSLAAIAENLSREAESPSLISHRRILGRPVRHFKRIFMNWADLHARKNLDKQRDYNRLVLDLLKMLILRSRGNRQKLRDLEDRLGKCEERLAVLITLARDLEARGEPGKAPADTK
jgi:hypothetical protein